MDLRKFIEKRLHDMLESGRGSSWGGPEAYEFQVLLLLELLYCAGDPLSFMMRYHRFFAPRHRSLGCTVLSSIISDHDLLASELRAFKELLESKKSDSVSDSASPDASSGHE